MLGVTSPLLALLAGALQLQPAPDGSVRVVEDGRVLARVRPATAATERGAPTLREHDSAGRRVVELGWPLRGRDARELWLGERGTAGRPGAPPRLEPLWQGLAGALDRDGESRLEIQILPDGIHAHQRAATVTRCDGPARLYPGRFDFAARRFAPLAPPPARGDAPVLRAEPVPPGAAALTGRAGFRWLSASDQEGADHDARRLTAPAALDARGVPWLGPTLDPAPESGRLVPRTELFVTARSPAPVEVVGLRIWPAAPGPDGTVAAPARLRLVLGRAPEEVFPVELAAAPDPQWIALPRPLRTACVTVVLESFHPPASGPKAGRRMGPARAALDAIEPLTLLDDGPASAAGQAPERLAAELLAGGPCEPWLRLADRLPADTVTRALAARLPEEHADALSDAVVACLARWAGGASADTSGRDLHPRLREVMVTAYTRLDGDAHGEARRAAERWLSSRPADPDIVATLARVLSRGPAPARERAAAALAAIDRADALIALLAALRTPAERPAARRALAQLDCAHLPRLLDALAALDPAEVERHADLLLALREALRARAATPTVRCLDGEPELAARLHTAALRGRAHLAFPVRARSLALLAALPLAEAVAQTSAAIEQEPDAVLRLIALESAREVPVPALQDRDPRVRATAARLLAARVQGRADDQVGAAVLDALARERWPFAQVALLEALGATCPPGTHDWLDGRVAAQLPHPAGPDARRAALEVLVRCRHPAAAARLVGVLTSRRASPALRERAAHLLAELPSDAVPGAALERGAASLLDEVRAAPDDPALEPVALAALHALARHLPGRALPRCLELLRQPRAPLRRGAIEVLGLLCDPGEGRAALVAARDGADGWLASAAATALARCALPP